MNQNALRILIIDDNPEDADLAARLLGSIPEWSCELHVIHSGANATSTIEEIDPDVVLLDYVIGCDNGAELLRGLRERGDDRPVIALTGQGDERIAAEITRAGADEYLLKNDLSRETLQRGIQMALDQWAVRRRKKQEINRKLEHVERLATVGETIASISHNMRGILTALKGSSALLDQAIANNDLETVANLWAVYKRSSDRLAHLAEAMLDFSRDYELRLKPATLNDVASELVQTQKRAAENQGVAVEMIAAPGLDECLIDTENFANALQAIVENAIQACAGIIGARVLIRTHRDRMSRRCGISIIDNGPGISNEALDKIFDPFFTTKGSKGTGLGLSIAHKSITAHHGVIELQTRPGRTVFTIWLPAARNSAAAAESADERPPRPQPRPSNPAGASYIQSS